MIFLGLKSSTYLHLFKQKAKPEATESYQKSLTDRLASQQRGQSPKVVTAGSVPTHSGAQGDAEQGRESSATPELCQPNGLSFPISPLSHGVNVAPSGTSEQLRHSVKGHPHLLFPCDHHEEGTFALGNHTQLFPAGVLPFSSAYSVRHHILGVLAGACTRRWYTVMPPEPNLPL